MISTQRPGPAEDHGVAVGDRLTTRGTVASARVFAQRKAWRQAYEPLVTAHRSEQLEGEDLERLAVVALLVGQELRVAGSPSPPGSRR